MEFLYYAAIWFVIGLLATFLRIYVFFRGPQHMLETYLSHPKTAERVKRLLISIRKDVKEDNKVIPHIVKVSFVFGAIFAPAAVIEMILDFCMFTWYTPPKNKGDSDEQGR